MSVILRGWASVAVKAAPGIRISLCRIRKEYNMACEKKPLIILTGPTAVGKTALSVKLARALNGEVISADSMQVYRHMDIGSAKVTAAQMGGIAHHLIDVLEPEEDFNVVLFQKLAKAAIADIYSRGRVPVLVGGTGFYIQSVLYDIDFTQTQADEDCRKKLERIAAEQGPQKLHGLLKEVDEKQPDRFMPIMSNGSSARWNIMHRPEKKYRSTMTDSGRNPRPMTAAILF